METSEMSKTVRWGGLALMLGALMFMLTKARGYVDPDDSLLGYFITVGFSLWLVGLTALYARYGRHAGRLGKIGLATAIVGIALLAAGHVFSFIRGVDMFMLVVVGGVALALGPLLFGVAALRKEVLPRYWRVLPLFTGLMGFSWFLLTSSEGSQLSFMVLRTSFALGWLLLGYVLIVDKREVVGGFAAGRFAPEEWRSSEIEESYLSSRTPLFLPFLSQSSIAP